MFLCYICDTDVQLNLMIHTSHGDLKISELLLLIEEESNSNVLLTTG